MKIIREDNSELEFTTMFEDENKASIFKHFKGNIYKVVTSGYLFLSTRAKKSFFSLIQQGLSSY